MYEKSEKYGIGNIKNVKDDNKNKKRHCRGGGINVKTREGIQWNKYYYYLINSIFFVNSII